MEGSVETPGPSFFPRRSVAHVDRRRGANDAPPMRALLMALTTFVVAGCAPFARPLESPYRATVAAAYAEAPRADAEPGYRADLALDRWVDDRFLVGVEVSRGAHARTRGREGSFFGAAIRGAYVLDLAEVQPRFGARVAAERWQASELSGAAVPAFLTGFVALDWAPRAWPLVIGAEVHTPAFVFAGSSWATPSVGYGLRVGHVF